MRTTTIQKHTAAPSPALPPARGWDAPGSGRAPAGPAAPVQHGASNPPVQRVITDLPDELLSNVLSRLPARDLAHTRAVSHRMQDVADATRVEGVGPTMGQVTEHMRGTELAGYHGASTEDAPSLYAGVRATDATEANWGSEQLGPGFYLTEGTERPEQIEADEFAKKRVEVRRERALEQANSGGASSSTASVDDAPMLPGEPARFRVRTRGLQGLKRTEVLRDARAARKARVEGADTVTGGWWGNVSGDVSNPQKTDYATSDIDTLRRGNLGRLPRQIKLNAHLLDPASREQALGRIQNPARRQGVAERVGEFGVEVLPPANDEGILGETYLRALRARLEPPSEEEHKGGE